jgi:putative protein-disulfide isomerase
MLRVAPMLSDRSLIYIADPMCSWCWGFAPVISAIDEAYKDKLLVTLIMGGLRPGTTEPVTPTFRETILRHWQEVQRRTGQPFKFDGAMPDGFIYDTEPPSRAVITIGELNPAAMLPYFRLIQDAFYADGRDVTRPETLAALVEHSSIKSLMDSLFQEDGEARGVFLDRFHSDDLKQKTQAHFYQSQQAGVTGFPTVILQDDTGVRLLTVGYQPFSELKPDIDDWLDENH